MAGIGGKVFGSPYMGEDFPKGSRVELEDGRTARVTVVSHHGYYIVEVITSGEAVQVHHSEVRAEECYCLRVMDGHRAGDHGCEFHADWTGR